MNSAYLVMFSAVLILSSFLASANESPFQPKTMNTLKERFSGQNWLIVLWSLDCPPCFKELALIQQLKQKHGKLPIVIINADDDDSLRDERTAVIKQFKLETLAHYYFTEASASTYRYKIDKHWSGELPRSYFVDAQGKFQGKSGLLHNEQIQQWLALK